MNNFDFIEQVRARPILWARTNEPDVALKDAVWDEIAQIMGCPREVLKSRWKNLRDTYRKVLRKSKRRTDSRGPATWLYSESMEFMREILTNSKVKVVDITSLAIEQLQQQQKEFAYGESEPSKRGVKREAEDDDVDGVVEDDEIKLEEEGSDDCQFLLSLLPYIKRVPHNRKLPLRVKIEQLIYDEVYSSNNYL